MPGSYRAGSLTVPGATGLQTVSGLGFDFECQGVLFFGSNRPEEDTLVTDANAGVFRGMMAREDTSAGALVQHVSSVIPLQGQQARLQAIWMQSVFDTVEYEATGVDMDDDSFTLDWGVVSASRFVQYFAWGDFDFADANRLYDAATTITLGWRVRSLLAQSIIQSGGGDGEWQRTDLPGYYFTGYGSGSYPTADGTSLWTPALNGLARSPNIAGQQHTYQDATPNPTTPRVVFGNGFIGPLMTQVLHEAYPVDDLDLAEDNTGGFQNFDMFAFWDGDSDADESTPGDATNDSITVPFENPDIATCEAILFFGTSGHGGNVGGDHVQAIGFGVFGPGYEGCVLVSEAGNYLWQSRQRSWCSNISAAGVNAGRVEAADGEAGFRLITEEDDLGGEPLAWIAFGPNDEEMPQIYRRVLE